MKQVKGSVMKLEPSTRFNLGFSGALQAMLAATALSLGTTYVASILFMVLGGVGLAYIALAVDGRLPVFPPQHRNDRSN